jgi:hypothetical protein
MTQVVLGHETQEYVKKLDEYAKTLLLDLIAGLDAELKTKDGNSLKSYLRAYLFTGQGKVRVS